MNLIFNRISSTSLLAGLLALTLSASASAHVVVKPAEVETASFTTFTVGVPNEKDIPTTSVKLVIPAGLNYVQPTQKSGWTIDIETSGSGESTTVKSITWSGNQVKVGFRDEFSFSGQAPDTTTELEWKAYQTYSDGTVVAWDKADTGHGHESEDENSGPFSVTEVVASSDEPSSDTGSTANTALYVGFAVLIVGLIGIYFGTRQK